MHSKFALGPRHMRTMVDIQYVAAEIRRGKKKIDRKKETTGQKYNGPPIT